jgi:hypothetical protein
MKDKRIVVVKNDDDTDRNPYGFCPICGSIGVAREKRPNGNDKCSAGHIYLSDNALRKTSYREIA